MTRVHLKDLENAGSIELTAVVLMDYILFGVLLLMMLFLLAKGFGMFN
jgi:hypothetical protein